MLGFRYFGGWTGHFEMARINGREYFKAGAISVIIVT